MIICITGTPGTGKTTLARMFQVHLPCQVVSLNSILLQKINARSGGRATKTQDVSENQIKKTILNSINDFKVDYAKIDRSDTSSWESAVNRLFQKIYTLNDKHSLSALKLRTILEKDHLLRKLNARKHHLKGKSPILIIESHFSHFEEPRRGIDWCFVTKTSLSTLHKRLLARKYAGMKIKANLEAEAFESSLIEAQEIGHKIIEINTG
jgi:broad-specificity NMP kinase